MASLDTDTDILRIVKQAYEAKAKSETSTEYANHIAKAFGYTPEQLQTVPAEAHMGLSCGNPVATATIREGETVLDLGCGGGIDVFLASDKIGSKGQAIGLDMSPEMIARARRNATAKGVYPPQVSFVQASLTEPLPIKSASVDCILSNCVINLLPLSGKTSLFREAYRVLKPGGRIVLDDIIAKKPLPENILKDLTLYVGCISGAIEQVLYNQLLVNAGFSDPVFIDTKHDLSVYSEMTGSTAGGCCTSCEPSYRDSGPGLSFDPNEFVASYQIYTIKPNNVIEAPLSTGSSALLRWWDAFPSSKSSPPVLSLQEVVDLKDKGTKHVIIDVRSDDYAGGHVRGSHQYPAQAFHTNLAEFFEKFHDVPQVVFYCGSSSGRAPRCAGWYQDYLNERGSKESKSFVLAGGYKAWKAKFEGDSTWIELDD